MRRLILFRYHDHMAICRSRVELLRELNPSVPVHSIYGGSAPSAPAIGADEHYLLPMTEPKYKWLHGDLCVLDWFVQRGHAVHFDMLHVVEWDLLLLRSIEELFGHIGDGVAVTAPRTIAKLIADKWYWVRKWRLPKLESFRRHVEADFRQRLTNGTQVAGRFPGAALSRVFLERYAAIEPPEIVHDEIRLPAFAQIFGMPVHDTRLGGETGVTPYFNCDKKAIAAASIKAAWKRHHQAAFHPVLEDIQVRDLFT